MKREVGECIVGKSKFVVTDPESTYYQKIGILAKELTKEFYDYSDSWIYLKFDDGKVKCMWYGKVSKIYKENIGRHIMFTEGPYQGGEAVVTYETEGDIEFNCLPDQGIPEVFMKGRLTKLFRPLTWEYIS